MRAKTSEGVSEVKTRISVIYVWRNQRIKRNPTVCEGKIMNFFKGGKIINKYYIYGYLVIYLFFLNDKIKMVNPLSTFF